MILPERPKLPPAQLFKFLKAEHADAMLGLGVVRIGTAQEMRQPDGKDDGRADPHELQAIWRPGRGVVTLTPDHPFLEFIGQKMPEGRTLDLVSEGDDPIIAMSNVYLYCTSFELTDELKKENGRGFRGRRLREN